MFGREGEGRDEILQDQPLPIVEIQSLQELAGKGHCIVQVGEKFPLQNGNELFQFIYDHTIDLEDLSRVPLVQIVTDQGEAKTFFLHVPGKQKYPRSDHMTLISELHKHYQSFVVTMTASLESFSKTPFMSYLELDATVGGLSRTVFIQLQTAGDILAFNAMGTKLPEGVTLNTTNSPSIVRQLFTDIPGVINVKV